jgi:hypothetical protein
MFFLRLISPAEGELFQMQQLKMLEKIPNKSFNLCHNILTKHANIIVPVLAKKFFKNFVTYITYHLFNVGFVAVIYVFQITKLKNGFRLFKTAFTYSSKYEALILRDEK